MGINSEERRYELKRAVKTFYDYQRLIIRLNNRIGLNKQGTNIKRDTVITGDERELYLNTIAQIGGQMDVFEKRIKDDLKQFPIWSEWLTGIKGIGWTMGAVIISEYDIDQATTVSKLWQFTGLNAGMVKGKKTKKKKDGTMEIMLTDDMIRGDRLTPGYNAPFNQWLRSKMVGVLADSFMRSGSYYRSFYDNYKHRLDSEEKWKDESKGHRNQAAKRYMIKQFLKDLYVAWRTLEGLPVRKPYDEEYLGHKHSA